MGNDETAEKLRALRVLIDETSFVDGPTRRALVDAIEAAGGVPGFVRIVGQERLSPTTLRKLVDVATQLGTVPEELINPPSTHRENRIITAGTYVIGQGVTNTIETSTVVLDSNLSSSFFLEAPSYADPKEQKSEARRRKLRAKRMRKGLPGR